MGYICIYGVIGPISVWFGLFIYRTLHHLTATGYFLGGYGFNTRYQLANRYDTPRKNALFIKAQSFLKDRPNLMEPHPENQTTHP